MKKISLFLTVSVVLSACTSSSNQPTSTAVYDVPPAIQTFINVCVRTDPTFNDARKKAIENGITDFTDAEPVGILGFSDDKAIGVQIKNNEECVITTKSKKDTALTEKFINALTQKGGQNKVPFGMVIRGERFIFFHDRKEGEAYVMLKAKK